MDRRNMLIAGVAVFLGLLAVYLANSWFSGLEARQEKAVEEHRLTQIAVASRDLAFGEPLNPDTMHMVSWPEQSVPAGAFRDMDQLSAAGNVAIRPIAAGEPILASRVSDRAVLSANLPKDMRAVSIPVSEVTGVAGFVTPGDVVDVLLTRQIPGDGATGDDQMTSVVMENVRVLAIDRRASENNTDPEVGKTATLQVDQFGAQKLTLANRIGTLSLALRNVENQQVGPTTVVTTRDLGGAGLYIPDRSSRSAPAQPRAAQATAPAPAISAPSQAPRGRTGPTMTIVRGTEGNEYEVQRYDS